MVVKGDSLAGLYIGRPEEAWEAASDLSAQLHINWVDRPFERVLSVMPKLYDDIWTGAKGMYKLEPAIEDGGEVIISRRTSRRSAIRTVTSSIRLGTTRADYFIKQWGRFKDFPLGVIAHSTHLKGIGSYDEATGTEYPRINVTLATRHST
jgi:nickel-dependent lactate racemase